MHGGLDIRWSWDALWPGHPVELGCALAGTSGGTGMRSGRDIRWNWDAHWPGCRGRWVWRGGRVRSARSIPLRSISLTGFALYKKRIRKFLMCKHNGISCFSFCALLIAYVDIIPHFPVNSYA